MPGKFVCKHYLLCKNYEQFKSIANEENFELQGTDNVQGQISEH